MSENTTYNVEILLDGEPQHLLEVPTTQGEDAAVRRAKWSWISLYGRELDDLDRVEARIYHGETEPAGRCQ